GNKKVCVVLIFNISSGSGATSLGTLMASELAKKTEKSTVYIEYPNYRNLASELNLSKNTKIFKHPRGFDIVVAPEEVPHTLPSFAITTLMFDRLMQTHENIVVLVQQAEIDENIRTMIDYAKQILLVVSPLQQDLQKLEELQQQIKRIIRLEETSLIVVLSKNKPQFSNVQVTIPYDFEIPYQENFPSHIQLIDLSIEPPKEVTQIVHTLVDRIDRNNQIAVFIPTTVEVDKVIDTSEYVEQTLKFLAERFGGATSKQAQGVWNSQQAGLVGEQVFIVNTYVTQNALRKYLDEVVDYVKNLKEELKQEAMALEINKKLTLI
ncbi:MAG: hypothetical protein NZ521_03680, partial [Flammeovirgaceae bacterium]|nr:hypothetical protein [Flammeovirgaceae bacterium]